MILDKLYDSDWFYVFGARYGLDHNDLDDVRQAVAIKYSARPRECEQGKELSYLKKVIGTCVADHRRSVRRFPRAVEVLEGDTATDEVLRQRVFGPLERVEAELDLRFLLERVPRKERDALRHRLCGWSYREIAASEGVPEQTIRRRVSRGVNRVRTLMDA